MRTRVDRGAAVPMAAFVAALGLACLPVLSGPSGRASAATVLVIEDFAPMRMVPSARAPRKAYAPLGLLLKTRRVNNRSDFVEATNGEQRPFEDPAWLHYWLRPSSFLTEPGATKISLDLVVHQRAGAADSSGRADFPGHRYGVATFLADSVALPDSYYVAATEPDDRSAWGGAARLPASTSDLDPPGVAQRASALRAERQYRLYVSLAGPKPIRSVRERIAVARVLVTTPSCGDFDYVETEVETVAERTRKIGGPGNTVIVPIPVSTLIATGSAAKVQWSRLVYMADVTFEDGTAETIARRLLVSWPHCL